MVKPHKAGQLCISLEFIQTMNNEWRALSSQTSFDLPVRDNRPPLEYADWDTGDEVSNDRSICKDGCASRSEESGGSVRELTIYRIRTVCLGTRMSILAVPAY